MESLGDRRHPLAPNTSTKAHDQYDLPSGLEPPKRTRMPASAVPKDDVDGAGAIPRTRGSWLWSSATHTGEPDTITESGVKTGLLGITMFMLGLAVYLLTRFWELVKFPIYFFCDEAIQANLAAMLVQNGMRDNQGWWFPPYFLNAEKWNLGWSVYVHVLPVALFGKSEYVTRGTTALVSMLGAVAIAMILQLIFRQRMWWLGVLVLGCMPAWLLHSRTAFETVMMVSFYACFLLCYLLYRYRNPRFLYLAVIFGAMTLYSYANGQGVMLVSATLLVMSDARYHLRHRWSVLAAALMLGFLALPYVRFQTRLPDAFEGQFQALNSYWVQRIPLTEKVQRYSQNYLQGLSPTYWFVPNETDLARHRFKGMDHIWLPFLPLFLLGLATTLRRWRSSAHRVLLIALLAAPFSAALVAISITRVLSFVVPATILICLGLEQLRVCLNRWIPFRPYAIGSAALLTVFSIFLLRDAIVHGPTWYPDYGLGGMQYGASQLFNVIPQILDAQPDTNVLLSPTWANNPNAFADFYLDTAARERFTFKTIDGWMLKKQPLDRSMLWIMTANEYGLAQASNKFVIEPPERVLRYPDNSPGFYFVRMTYRPNIDEAFAMERELRSQLVEEEASLDGQPITVRHSMLDGGSLPDLFDDDTRTLIRGLEANPFVIELQFGEPRSVGGIELDLGTMARFDVRVMATPAGGSTPRNAMQQYENFEPDPHIELAIPGGPQPLSKLRVEVQDYTQLDEVHVHVRGLKLSGE